MVLLGVWVDGAMVLHLAAPFPWAVLARGVIGGWVATIPLAALQLWVATWWKSFAAPFSLNVMCTIPATAISGSSTVASIYPWSQPMLAMLPGPHGTFQMTPTAVMTLLAAGSLFIVVGWMAALRQAPPVRLTAKVLAIGDGLNDVDLLMWAGDSAAPAGAAPAAIAAARRIVASCDQGAVAVLAPELVGGADWRCAGTD